MVLTKRSTSNFNTRLSEVREGNVLILKAPELHVQVATFTASIPLAVSGEDNPVESVPANLREFIAFEFSLVPEVETVFTALRENQVFYAWIVTNEFEAAVRKAIYTRQQAIIDEFPDFEFDFYIIARLGRDLEDLVGDPSMHKTYSRPEGARSPAP